ncbi:MAG: hypothetical protein ACFBSE_00400 [Prochloraceae cyanobacterium]
MASADLVKRYLAHWFQLGKNVSLRNGKEILPPPRSIIYRDRYSNEFEQYWNKILSPESAECYLEGTQQSIQELLSSNWDIMPCARCQMPVALISNGIKYNDSCPCSDLNNWPNTEIPQPRCPVDNFSSLKKISLRLNLKQSS